MSLWRQLSRGVRVLVRRDAADRDFDDEMAHFAEQAAAALEQRGLSPAEARRAVRRDIGSPGIVREQVRAAAWEYALGTVLTDIRYGVRRLGHDPGFTIVSVVTLALGIGASTAIFSAVNPILFEPLPYPDAGRIVAVWDRGADGARNEVTFGTFRELVERSRGFDAMAVYKPWQPTMTGPAEPERFEGQRVTAGYFRALGVAPALGRGFDPSDDAPAAPKVVVIGDGVWKRRFDTDATIVGRPIVLDGDAYTVIGVMPGGFDNVLSPAAEVWTTLRYDPALPIDGREWGHHLRMLARLRQDTGSVRAGREIDAIAAAPHAAFPRPPWAALDHRFVLNLLQDDVTRAVRPALLAVLAAVGLLLAIACVNVANLMLARGARRRGELAMRAALGAGKARIVRQLVTENLVLAALGGAVGMAAAAFGVEAIKAVAPAGLPRAGAIRIDAPVLAFGVAVTTAIGVALGLVPAWRASAPDLQGALQGASRGTAGGRRAARRVLVIAQVGLALVLLAGAGLLLRSLQRLFAVAPGFDSSGVLTLQVQAGGRGFGSVADVHRFFDEALDRVRRVPGVVGSALTSQLPMSGDREAYGVRFERDVHDGRDDRGAIRYAISPGYFETLHIPLRRGRLLDARDTAHAPRVALISESLARRVFADRDPVGRRVQVGSAEFPWYTIAGVVGDVRHTSLAGAPPDAVYTTIAQWGFADNPLTIVIRAGGDAAALAHPVRRAIWSVDKDQPIVRVALLEQVVAATAAERRFALVLFEAFAAVALVLAAIGVYGLIAGSVSERTREIGVRMALGAARPDVLALVMREGMMLTAAGVAIGLAGAAAASRALVTLLFGVSRLDPPTYVAVTALLAGASALACWLPAWRAARIDPALTLRAE